MDNTLVSNKDGLSLEDRIVVLEKGLKDLSDLYRAIGKQNADLKTRCNGLEIDIQILKQGGNL